MSLRDNDLQDLVYRVFEVDAYKSKMGNDSDIVVLSFTVNEEAPARDLVNFIEKGYSFVLDADVSSGEQFDGMYRVFVELERNSSVPEQIMEIMNGVGKLSGRTDWKYRYYKSFKSMPLNIESLQEQIPLDALAYTTTVTESNMNNFKNFFNKSYLESIKLVDDDEIFLKKAYADPIAFKIREFGSKQSILESIQDRINVNDYAEILFLTKYLGDYNICKFGKNLLTLENKGYTLVLERL